MVNNMSQGTHVPQLANFSNNELYKKICQEFINMKNNYDKVQHAQMALRNTALEPSSLDNLIMASQNPMETNRQRLDSLQNVTHQQFGRKRAMTMDGPVKNKYVRLNHTKKSAFVSFKNHPEAQNLILDTKDEEDNSKDEEMKAEEPRLNKKRTHAVMEKDSNIHSSHPLLSQDEDFPKRKRARSF